jgi:hypothetical protein
MWTATIVGSLVGLTTLAAVGYKIFKWLRHQRKVVRPAMAMREALLKHTPGPAPGRCVNESEDTRELWEYLVKQGLARRFGNGWQLREWAFELPSQGGFGSIFRG